MRVDLGLRDRRHCGKDRITALQERLSGWEPAPGRFRNDGYCLKSPAEEVSTVVESYG